MNPVDPTAPRIVPLLVALTLVVAAGVVHGRWTRRWAGSHAVEAAAAGLARLPLTVGGWHALPLELDRGQLEIGEIDGYIARRYEHAVSGAFVTVLVVCGRPGPISLHTPDVCYAGAGYEPTRPPDRRSFALGPDGRPGEFRHAVFGRTNTPVPAYLRILWSWSSGGAWEAPDVPRIAFARRPVLFKLYLIRGLATAHESLDGDPSLQLLNVLVPELERVLFAPPAGDPGRHDSSSSRIAPRCHEAGSHMVLCSTRSDSCC